METSIDDKFSFEDEFHCIYKPICRFYENCKYDHNLCPRKVYLEGILKPEYKKKLWDEENRGYKRHKEENI